ncbi:MAG: hypothetical protein A3F12_06400 [Gammaproteobacteria bacterium RIFCSPHIGHO2_12_FULL_38_14]|nr:MAG: hypothetical protein A3F12_06400 [Gammaproteobacteria bacterium RIFCSPHIGHO2_12_FULL_38_14]
MDPRQVDLNNNNAEQQTRRLPKVSVHPHKKNKLETPEDIKKLLNKEAAFDYFKKFRQLLEENPSIIDDHHAEIRGDTQHIGNSSSVRSRCSLGVKLFLPLILMNENIADVDVFHFEFVFDEETITLSIHSKEKITRDRIDDLFRRIRFVNFLHVECGFSLGDIFTLIKDAFMRDSTQSIIEAVKSKIVTMYENNNLSEKINHYFSKQVTYKKIPSDLIQESDNAPSDLANDQESPIESGKNPKKRKLIRERDQDQHQHQHQHVKYRRGEQSVETSQLVLITDDEQAAIEKLHAEVNTINDSRPGRITAFSDQELEAFLNSVMPTLPDDQNLTVHHHDADVLPLESTANDSDQNEQMTKLPTSAKARKRLRKKMDASESLKFFNAFFSIFKEENRSKITRELFIVGSQAEIHVDHVGESYQWKMVSAAKIIMPLLVASGTDIYFGHSFEKNKLIMGFTFSIPQEKVENLFKRLRFISNVKGYFKKEGGSKFVLSLMSTHKKHKKVVKVLQEKISTLRLPAKKQKQLNDYLTKPPVLRASSFISPGIDSNMPGADAEDDESIQQRIFTEKRELRPSLRERASSFFENTPHTQDELLGKFCFLTQSNPTIIGSQHVEMVATNIGYSKAQPEKYFNGVLALLSLLKRDSDDYSIDIFHVKVNESIVVRFKFQAYDQEKRDDFFHRIKFIQFLKSLCDRQPVGFKNGLSYADILAVIKRAFDAGQDIVKALKSDMLAMPLHDDLRQQIENYFSKPVIYQSIPSHLSEENVQLDVNDDDPLAENSTSASDQEMLHGQFQFDSRGYRRNSLGHCGFGNNEKNPAENKNMSPPNDFDEDSLKIGNSM